MTDWLWVQRSLPAAMTGADLWEALYAGEPITVLLESPAQVPSKLARYSIAAGKPLQIWTPAVGEILPCLEELRSQMQAIPQSENFSENFSDLPDHLPFTGGYLGWLGYDLAWEIERLPYTKPDNLPFPVAFWYKPSSFAVIDHQSQDVWLAASDRQELKELGDRLDRYISHDLHHNQIKSTECLPLANIQLPSYSPEQQGYEAMVETAKGHIYAGDIFQSNLSLRFGYPWQADGWQLYRHLQKINPSPFASYWRTTWGEVISVSPERLVSLRDRHAETRPIAGTRPRGKTPEQDLALGQELLACTKEQAEHIMLVDLERNDLGRVCEWGTVQVDELLAIERYSHVMHLVSNVVGKLRSDRTLVDLIRATFPGGTITGCPKVRCMEIIEKLEPQRRSLFYGSCGYIDKRGNMDLNILIRTLLKTNGQIWGQVGAGIVADSVSDREWRESLQKAQAQLAALGLIPN
ncbi:anthranilate synthase component I [Pseudanabaena sp. FACHB-1998]|uniref:anthranilate synthase component I n=1 Tax=Pseudanabaena sp. FACHB-1998 TaxID=2692858 RepID=UPI0016804B6A|nr:anthranilate synthase component I [Pseudanabaena sp. FACHB-1998]MBD2178270.1 anthranilate synthase component I [Pseudanabaena sp. FACHB-1998]